MHTLLGAANTAPPPPTASMASYTLQASTVPSPANALDSAAILAARTAASASPNARAYKGTSHDTSAGGGAGSGGKLKRSHSRGRARSGTLLSRLLLHLATDTAESRKEGA